MKKLQAENNAILIEAGDTFLPPPMYRKFDEAETPARTAFIREQMAKLTYDAFVPGAQDLESGLDPILEFQKSSGIPILCANMADAESGEAIFPASRVVERGGVRVALIGVVGPLAYAGVPANVDFDSKTWAREHRPRGPHLLKKFEEIAKTGDDNGAEATTEQLKSLASAFQDPAEGDEPQAASTPPPVAGKRFRVSDAAAAVKAEVAKLSGKADLFVAVGYLSKDELNAFTTQVPEVHFLVDSNSVAKPSFPTQTTQGPNLIRTGNKGKTLGLLRVSIVGKQFTFADRSSRKRDEAMLDKMRKQYEKMREDAGGKDPLETYAAEDGRHVRAQRIKDQIDKFTVQANVPATGSWFEVERLTLGENLESDPEIKTKMDELEPPEKRKH